MVLDRVQLPDHLSDAILGHVDLPGLDAAYRLVHRPRTRADDERGRDRLRFDEAFIPQLALVRRRRVRYPGVYTFRTARCHNPRANALRGEQSVA